MPFILDSPRTFLMPWGRYPFLLLRLRDFLGRYFILFLFFIAACWFNEALSLGFASLLPVLIEPLAEMSTVKLAFQCARNPNAAAVWQEFIARVQGQLRQWALQALRTFQQKEIAHYREAVDDIVQEVYVRLVQNDCQGLRAFNGKSEDELFGYLKRIAHNVALNRMRQNAAQKRPRLAHSLDELTDSPSESHSHRSQPRFVAQALDEEIRIYELHEHLNHYLDVVLRGPQKHRDKMLFQLFHYEGLTIEELEKLPGLSLSRHAIEVAINRVSRRLAKHIKQIKQ